MEEITYNTVDEQTFDELLHKFKSDKVLVPFIHSDKTYYKIKISIHNVIELLILIQCYVLVKIDPTRIDDRIYPFAETAKLFDKTFTGTKFDAHFRNAITLLLGVGGLDITDFDANIYNEIVKSHFIELNNLLQIKSINLCRLNKTIQEVKQVTTDIITQGIEITDHRSSIDLISVTVDNTIQTLTKLEQMHKIQIDDIQNRISSIESIQPIQYQKHKTILNEHQKIIELNTESIDLANSEITRIENIQTYQYETLLERVNTVETLHKKYVNIVGNMIHQLENNRKENSIQHQRYNTDCELYVEKCNQLTDRIKSIELQVTEFNNYVAFLINFVTHLMVFLVCVLFIYINYKFTNSFYKN